MSGMEVVGVVLGSIPLIISALEHYQEGIQTIRRWQSYQGELQSLKRQLANEKAIFVNTCQQLLSGIVASVDNEKLIITDPLGGLWSDPGIRDQIALRLDHVLEPFEATVAAMSVALMEVRTRLGLGVNGEIKWTEGKAIVREIKRATFTIKRSSYDDLMKTISKGNQDLKTLTNQSIQLEPERRVRYHGILFSKLREVSRSAYNAIRNSIRCNCAGSHRVNLRLKKPRLVSRDDRQQITKTAVFDCGISYHFSDINSEQAAEAWEQMVLRIYEPDSATPRDTNPDSLDGKRGTPSFLKTMSSSSSQQSKPLKKPKGVQFFIQSTTSSWASGSTSSSTSRSTETTTLSTPVATISAAAMVSLQVGGSIGLNHKRHHLPDPVDLCETLSKHRQRQSHTECFGLITDSTSPEYPKFGVYPSEERHDSTAMISLRDVLQDQGSPFPQLSYTDSLQLAVDICSGVLQLCTTSWLPDVLTSADILFRTGDGGPRYDQAFVAQKISDADTLSSNQQPSAKVQMASHQVLKNSMFSLGVLLAELLFFEDLDHMRAPSGDQPRRGGSMGRFTDWRAAKDILDRVQFVGGPNFYSAIKRFLFFEFVSVNAATGDEGFYTEVYGKTIALLEEDQRLLQQL